VFGVEGVVQHYEQAAIGQFGAPQGAALDRRDRDAVGGHAQLAQERLERGGGVDPLPVGGVGPQVDEELTVRVTAGEAVGHVDGERGLADPGHAVDGDDRPLPAQQPFQLGGPSGEIGNVVRQESGATCGPRRDLGWAGAGRQQLGVVGQDGPFQLHERVAGIQPLLVGESRTVGARRGQRVRLASGSVQGQDEVPVELLA
jgi:hypothetical protein